jgi:hypothetical protein
MTDPRAAAPEWNEPSEENRYLERHATRLLQSHRHWTGKSLVDPTLSPFEQARQLFCAPFVVLSHDTSSILNYANRTGLDLFELYWKELIAMPSRETAEPGEQAERERLLQTVARQGYMDNYRGIRIAKTGRRFLIEQATVWNLLDENGGHYGQAATFTQWKYLEG